MFSIVKCSYRKVISFQTMRRRRRKKERNCFFLSFFLYKRCNDVQELTSTIAQFTELSSTARIGGTLTSTMDAMLAEIQSKSCQALDQFHAECPNLSNLMDSDRFDLAFFRLRTELKQYEHELAWILRQCFSRATTLQSKLTLLDVFHGAYQRDVVQRALQNEEQWITEHLKQEFQSVEQLIRKSHSNYCHQPPIARQLLFLFGLKQRIDNYWHLFIDLCPKIVNSDLGWELKESFRIATEKIAKFVFLLFFLQFVSCCC